MNSKSIGGALLSVLLLHSLSGMTQESATRGIEAFKRGHYAEALEYFREEERAGRITPALRYNLAVSYYRLGRHDDAEQRFRQLIDDPRWGGIARYNLGLLALLRDDEPAARRWFDSVRRTTRNEQLQNAARDKLALLEKRPVAVAPRDWQVYFSLSAGFDDNAASLADELNSRSSDAEDEYWEALGYGTKYLSGSRGDGLKGYGLVYTQQYRDFGDFDSTLYGAGLARELPLGDFDTEMGLLLARTEIGSDHLADFAQLKLLAARQLGANRWSASYQPSYFDASSKYQQIEGWQHRLELGWQRVMDTVTLRGRYRFDRDDRDDLAIGDQFYSYSPRRHVVMADLAWQIDTLWTLNGQIAYTYSDYSDTNRLVDTDGQTKEKSRQTDRWEYTAGLAYQLTPRWSLSGRYQYTDNEDNFDLYTYDKQQVSVGIEFLY